MIETERVFVYNGRKERGGVDMKQYIGKLVQLIYIDSKQQVTIRNVQILAVGEHRLLAYCHQAKGVRTFTRSGIVDMEVIQWKAS